MKALSLSLVFILISLITYSQVRYDIGIKTSSFEQDRLQLEQRLHLNPDYFLLLNFNLGATVDAYGVQEDVSGDEIMNQRNFTTEQQFYSCRFGVGKRLTSLPTDFFYCATSIGVGYEEWLYTDNNFYMYYDENGSNLETETGLATTVESTFDRTFKSGAFYQLYLTFGMDVPLSKRLYINCELNGLGAYHSAFNSLMLRPSFSVGFRYSFGKVNPITE